MQFPLYNIDAKDLGEDYTLGLEFVRYDAIYYSNDEVFWKTYFLNNVSSI